MKPAPGRMALLLAAILSASGAGAVSAQQPVNASYFRQVEADAAQRYDEFEKRYREFIQVVEYSLALRRDAIELFTKLHEKLGGESHLSAANQRALQANLDDLAVVRPDGLSDTQKRIYLLAAFAQVGKAYDFNFDVETNHTIVCSELAYVVFHDVDWPVEESVGRYTVSPDHIATLARSEGDPFTPVLIYHDGRALPAEHLHRNLDALLREDYDRVIWQ